MYSFIFHEVSHGPLVNNVNQGCPKRDQRNDFVWPTIGFSYLGVILRKTKSPAKTFSYFFAFFCVFITPKIRQM